MTVSLPTAMRTEIGQQPAALRATLDALLPRGGRGGPARGRLPAGALHRPGDLG